MLKEDAEKKINAFLLLTVTIAATGGLLFGFDTGNIAGALIFIKQSWHTSTFTDEVIVSITVLGAFVGAILSGTLVERLGRRKMMLAAATLFILGASAGSFVYDVSTLLTARLLLGLAIGISSYTAPLYISEVAPAQFRGLLVLLHGVAITLGEAVAFVSDYVLSSGRHWRIMIFLGVIPALILFIGMLKMPASPRWLIAVNKVQMAKTVLQQIRRRSNVDQEFSQIKNIVESPKFSLKALVLSEHWRKPLMIGIGLGMLQQFFGINTVMYYGPFIFKSAGFQSHNAQILATFSMGVVNMLMTIFTGFYVDRWGRRKLLMGGSLLAGFSLLSIPFLLHRGPDSDYSTWLLLGAMIFYVIGYCLSVGSLFWLIISEIFPLRVRATAMSLATAIQWLANLLVSLTFLTMLDRLGTRLTFSIYASLCFLGFFFSYCLVPETKGLSLETIESHWHKKCN